jgi:hypothetical protein
VDFFRAARRDCTAVLSACQARGWHRIVLCGAGELAEIAVLSAADAEVEILCVIDAASTVRSCARCPVVADFAEARLRAGAEGIDAIVVTDARTAQDNFTAMLAVAAAFGLKPERVVAPDLLRISRDGSGAAP